tara:strand:- start:17 stop:391 length:375 start_codon:yes stop_codon:yes gene_type:complete
MSQITPQFTDTMKKWIQYDLEIEKLNKRIKDIRDEKGKIETKLVSYMEQKEITDNAINFANQRVVYANEKSYQSLSFKLLQQCFNEYFGNVDQSDELLSFIREKRKLKVEAILKRKASSRRGRK